jgi:signal transduction histidine kinase
VVSTPLPAAVAALCVAVGFRPVRDRIQDAVDRRFRRARYETRRVMSDFVDSLRRGTASIEDLEPTLRTALGDPGCRVLFEQEDGAWHDIDGRAVTRHLQNAERITRMETSAQVTAVVVHGESGERLTAEALDAGRLAIEIGALQVDLRRQLDELAASRARVVAAADTARRRIARDLHDGAQQRLVTIGLTVRHVQHALDGSAPVLHAELDSAVTEIGHAIDDLRDLAGGLRPASLDHGLRAALDELAARTATPVKVDVTPDRFGPEIETAAYFIVSEGLTNAVKHAHAATISLAVAREAGHLVVAVEDDGDGGADPRAGTGLRGLADRARAHGGNLEITSMTGRGTSVRAQLPCG